MVHLRGGRLSEEIAGLIQVLNPKGGWLKGVIDLSRDILTSEIRAAARGRLGSDAPAHDDSAVFLALWAVTAATAC